VDLPLPSGGGFFLFHPHGGGEGRTLHRRGGGRVVQGKIMVHAGYEGMEICKMGGFCGFLHSNSHCCLKIIKNQACLYIIEPLYIRLWSSFALPSGGNGIH